MIRPINISFHQEKIFVVYLFLDSQEVKSRVGLDFLYSQYVNTCRQKLNTKYIFGISKFSEIMQELGCVRHLPRKDNPARNRFWKIPSTIEIDVAFDYIRRETDRLIERAKEKK
jgi:hypothetical protein